jgi:Tol biopolymer transport system component
VHRDLKPGNIMVTPAGQVKVLDFGLARRAKEWSDPAASKNVTMTGEVLGTPAYMSPEQALGEAVGTASDIFSFGVILYELACGVRPFEGHTPMATLQQVLQCAPAPPRKLNGKIRPDLAALIEHCLERRPEARPASIADVAEALRNLSKAPDTAVSAISARGADRKPLRWMVRRPWIRWAGAAVAAAALAAAAYWAGFVRHRAVSGEIAGAPELARVTFDSGLNIDPSISADGKFVAYSSDRSGDGNLDIWVQQIGGGSPIRVTRDAADDREPDISPDGTHVVYHSERNGGGIYIAPTTGGEEQRIADGGRRPRYSPDGSKVLYYTGPATHYPLKDGIGEIFVVDLARSTTRRIRPDFTAAVDPIWSPDGEKILFVGAKESVTKGWGWWITPLDGGGPVRCPVNQDHVSFIPFAWQGDWVYFEWTGTQPQPIGRMRVDAASGRVMGEPQRVSAATGDAYSPSVSRAGQMVFSVWDASRSLYSLALDPNDGKPKGLTRLSKEPGVNIVRSISPDGTRLVFTSDRFSSGKYLQVWVRDLVTGVERAVTAGDNSKGISVIAPDGLSIAWRSGYNVPGISLTPFEGGLARVLCSDCGTPRAWSPNGTFLLYDRMDGRRSIGILETSGKARPYLAADSEMRAASLSNDGKWVTFLILRSAVDFTVYVAPFASDRPPPASEWVKVAESPEVHPDPQWSPDANLLYFTSERDGYDCIWAMRLNRRTKRPEGPLFAVQHFHEPARALLAPSSKYIQFPLARNKIAITLRETSGGIWMTKVDTGR